MATQKTVIAFDLYGTLLSTDSIAKELAKLYGEEKAQSVATLWRRYQLEYTWRINSMVRYPSKRAHSADDSVLTPPQGLYRSFSEITEGALQHAVAESGSELSADHVDKLMKAYDSLHAFPEVPRALDAVRENPDIDAYIFSNGTETMVNASIQSSPDLNPYADLFKGLVTVHELQVFKPAKRVYEDLVTKAGKDGNAGDVWIVTANPFDAVGSTAAGLKSAWIDRAGRGWVDRLGDVIGGIRPTVIVSGVDEAVSEIIKQAS
jgi:2-haloacid dehalogenase